MAQFGGVKESGFGTKGGRHGIEEFQISKVYRVSTSKGEAVDDIDHCAGRSGTASYSSTGFISHKKRAQAGA